MFNIVYHAQKLYRTCKDCKKFKKRNSKYGSPWHTVYVDLIGTYTIIAKVRQTDNEIITKELQLLCMTIIDSAKGWFETAEVPIIYQYSARTSQIFN